MLKPICLTTAWLLGLLAVANGAFMLASPDAWYVAGPGVTTTGPFNQHFIRDIGIIFLFLGAAFAAGAARAGQRIVLWGAATLWLACHALFHFWEVAAGICGPAALARDFPAVTLPALLGAALTFWSLADRRTARAGATT
jgi:hypothetical protein